MFRQKLKKINTGLSFNDVFLKPRFSQYSPRYVNVKTNLTKDIILNVPLLSAAMDKVTEHELAIEMARLGGLGVIHKNMSVESQAKEVALVKKAWSGIIDKPITLSPKDPVKKAIDIMKKERVSGIPIVEKKNKLVGIITRRDIEFQKNLDEKIEKRMTPKKKLVVMKKRDDFSRDEYFTKAKEIFRIHRLEKLLIVDDKFKLEGLLTKKDIQNIEEYPNAALDKEGRLLVGASIGPINKKRKDLKNLERAKTLVKKGVDVIVIDTAHGHIDNVRDTLLELKKKFGKKVQLIAGNIATYEGAKALIEWGADAVKVGMGPGSICTTRIISGMGVPQMTAVEEAKRAVSDLEEEYGFIGVIADGGITYSGDITKAIATGANCVMIGSLFAGTDEAPGEVIFHEGRAYKRYRGMGSIGAMTKGSAERYGQKGAKLAELIPEGVEGAVPLRGPLKNVVTQLIGGLKSGMAYCGCKTLDELYENAEFNQITLEGSKESHVHGIFNVQESPNYQR